MKSGVKVARKLSKWDPGHSQGLLTSEVTWTGMVTWHLSHSQSSNVGTNVLCLDACSASGQILAVFQHHQLSLA